MFYFLKWSVFGHLIVHVDYAFDWIKQHFEACRYFALGHFFKSWAFLEKDINTTRDWMPCTRDQLIWILTWIVSGCIMKILIWNWDLLNSNGKIRGQKFLMFMIWWARKKWIVSKLVSNTYTIESPMSHLQVTGESPVSHPGVNRESILSHP